jgi:hypothetical protein
MDYLETYDFYATSRENAEKKMEAVIRKHYWKYGKMLRIQNLRLINYNLRRANLVTNEK